MICLNSSNESVGAIDLYDADFKNGNVAVGILIGEKNQRGKGFAKESLELIVEYARDFLAMYNLYCSIQADNLNSLKLFESVGFDPIGVRKDWFLYKGQRIDEISYQLCLKK